MAQARKHYYLLDAFGLIILYAFAMALIAFPLRWMEQSSLPSEVYATRSADRAGQ